MLVSPRILLGMGVSLAFLLLFFVIVDVGDMGQALAAAKYRFILPAIALYFVALFFRSLRWQFLLEPVSRIPVARLFPVVTVGYMANNLLPARLGEIARAYYLERREGLSTSTGLATVVVERIYDGLTLLFLVALAVPFLIFGGLVDGSGTTSEITWAIVGGINRPRVHHRDRCIDPHCPQAGFQRVHRKAGKSAAQTLEAQGSRTNFVVHRRIVRAARTPASPGVVPAVSPRLASGGKHVSHRSPILRPAKLF